MDKQTQMCSKLMANMFASPKGQTQMSTCFIYIIYIIRYQQNEKSEPPQTEHIINILDLLKPKYNG